MRIFILIIKIIFSIIFCTFIGISIYYFVTLHHLKQSFVSRPLIDIAFEDVINRIEVMQKHTLARFDKPTLITYMEQHFPEHIIKADDGSHIYIVDYEVKRSFNRNRYSFTMFKHIPGSEEFHRHVHFVYSYQEGLDMAKQITKELWQIAEKEITRGNIKPDTIYSVTENELTYKFALICGLGGVIGLTIIAIYTYGI